MSNGAVLSLLGMYNWDDSLFDDMAFPEGFTADDETTFINNLLMECAELEIIYSNWTFLHGAIKAWSVKELPTWQRIYNASLLEYNPIENYNRTEETTHQNFGSLTHSGKDTVQASGSDTNALTGTDSVSRSGSDTDTTSKTAYDSNAFADVQKVQMTKGTLETDNISHSETLTHGKKDETTYGHVITDATGHEIDSNISGNIGVTTSQQMLEQELEIAPKLNIMNYMIASFKNRFCLLVY